MIKYTVTFRRFLRAEYPLIISQSSVDKLCSAVAIKRYTHHFRERLYYRWNVDRIYTTEHAIMLAVVLCAFCVMSALLSCLLMVALGNCLWIGDLCKLVLVNQTCVRRSEPLVTFSFDRLISISPLSKRLSHTVSNPTLSCEDGLEFMTPEWHTLYTVPVQK